MTLLAAVSAAPLRTAAGSMEWRCDDPRNRLPATRKLPDPVDSVESDSPAMNGTEDEEVEVHGIAIVAIGSGIVISSAVKEFAMRAWILVGVIGLASAPDAVAAPTTEQLGAVVAAVNALLPEPGAGLSAAAVAFSLALLTGRRSPR